MNERMNDMTGQEKRMLEMIDAMESGYEFTNSMNGLHRVVSVQDDTITLVCSRLWGDREVEIEKGDLKNELIMSPIQWRNF